MEEIIQSPVFLEEVFELSAVRYPDAIAIENGTNSYSYLEAEQLANRIAHFLITKGMAPEEKAVVLLPRCELIYPAMLAVLKTGGAYIPLDVEIPAERLRFIMEDSGARILITADEIIERMAGQMDDLPVLNMNRLPNEIDELPSTKPQIEGRRPDNLCYIIYTSGTSGMPKGVLLEHRNVLTYVRGALRIYPILPTDRVLQGFSVSFDASVEEIWVTFAAGATLVVGTFEIMRSGSSFSSTLTRLKITFLSCAPTLLSMVKEDIPSLRILIFGGEVCPVDMANRWCRDGRMVYNTYGPKQPLLQLT